MEQALAPVEDRKSSEFSVSLLESPYVDFYWPMICAELDRVPQIWEERWTKDGLFEAVLDKRMQVWAVGPKEKFTLVVFTQIALYPAGKSLQLILAIGSGLDDCLPILDATLTKFAQSQDCSMAEVVDGRGGWGAKLYSIGFRKSCTILSRPVVSQRLH